MKPSSPRITTHMTTNRGNIWNFSLADYSLGDEDALDLRTTVESSSIAPNALSDFLAYMLTC